MSFQRITLSRLDKSFRAGPKVVAQYNPTEITFEKGVQIAEVAIPGIDAPILQFVRGQSETVSLELFFDTTEFGTAGPGLTPVTVRTDAFFQLIKIDPKTHAPPILRVTWGESQLPGWQFSDQWASQSRTGFQCVVESVQQQFTLFSPEGLPLRAKLSVKLREYRTLDQQLDAIKFESPDHFERYVVQDGDTLSGIAARTYDDPSVWREIAEANQIVDPSELPAGLELRIPALT